MVKKKRVKKQRQFKNYIIKTKISTSSIKTGFEEFLEVCKNCTDYPSPIYEIFLSDKNQELFSLLLDEQNLGLELVDIKNKEQSIIRTNSFDSSLFLSSIDQNSQIFDFNVPLPTEKYQQYISKNLKNLSILKYSIEYYLIYNKISKEFEKIVLDNLNTDLIDDFESLKSSLLDFIYDSYKEIFTNKFSIEKTIDLADTIIDISSDKNKLDIFHINILSSGLLSNVDTSSKKSQILSELLINQINPRIQIIIDSIKNILERSIQFLENIEEDEIQIRESDNSKYFSFFYLVKKYTNFGAWTFSKLIESQISIEEESEENSQTGGLEAEDVENEDLNQEDEDLESNEEEGVEEEDLVNLDSLYNINNFIATKEDEIDGATINNFNEYIHYKLNQIFLNNFKASYKIIINDMLDESVAVHDYIIQISKNYYFFLIEEIKEAEELENELENTDIDEILDYLYENYLMINQILVQESFHDWYKDRIINYFYINPWISFVNTKIYLRSDFTKEIEFDLPFIEMMERIQDSEEKIDSSDIAENYLEEIYKLYEESVNISRYKIIFDEFETITENINEFKINISQIINKLFEIADDIPTEEKVVISCIFKQKLIPDDNDHNNAITRLSSNGIIMEIKNYAFGIMLR